MRVAAVCRLVALVVLALSLTASASHSDAASGVLRRLSARALDTSAIALEGHTQLQAIDLPLSIVQTKAEFEARHCSCSQNQGHVELEGAREG